MRYHKLISINPKGLMSKMSYYNTVYYHVDRIPDISYVVNGADPKAKIKHIIECIKLLNGT